MPAFFLPSSTTPTSIRCRVLWIPLLLVGTLVTPFGAVAEEGMWPPSQLPQLASELETLGLEIPAQQLSNLTTHPMNAVVSLGGCTASFVSPQGLVVTNHHCAQGSIQFNSTPELNLLEDGFLAAEPAEELRAGPGSRVLVTVSAEDVTAQVLSGIDAATVGRERFQKIEQKEKELVAACEKEPGHRCNVYPFYGGLEYQLIKQLEIRDVRLAYVPPRAVGNFGGDIDNWMWPRHTGDYSFYRAYVGADGKPADYAPDNVPYHPTDWLKVSTDGLRTGDLVMVAGYPGRTYRHRLAKEVDGRFNWYYPTRRQLYLEWLEIIGQQTADREDAKILYASWDARLNNAAKNYMGMVEGFAKSDILERKALLEAELQAWIEADAGRRERYLSAVTDLQALVDESESLRVRQTFYESMAQRSSLLSAARKLYRFGRERQKPDMEREPGYQERDETKIRESLERLNRSYDPAVDRAIWRHFIVRYAATAVDQHEPAFDEWFGISGNQVDEDALDGRLDEMYADTSLADKEQRLTWMEAGAEQIEVADDPFLRLAAHLYDSDIAAESRDKELQGRLQQARPLYMSALIAFLESRGQAVYPDANSTLRVTYGTVKGYSPQDAVSFTPFTRLEGIAAKNTGEEPFDVPAAELEAIAEKRYGRFAAEELGSVAVNFLSTVDSTGGNSGSPTLNGKAELVGLLFDGNYESITADWDYIPAITRSIHVDIRYVLWLMAELDGAENLLREMGVTER